MRRRGLVSQLYRTARLANDVSAITSAVRGSVVPRLSPRPYWCDRACQPTRRGA